MPIERLERLFEASNKIAALNFRNGRGHVEALLDPVIARASLRDALTHERKLFTLVDEGASSSTRPQLEPPTPLRGPGPLTIDKLIRGANVLAQICGLEKAKEYISQLNQRHEEITSSIDSLESIKEKQQKDFEKFKNLYNQTESNGNEIVSQRIEATILAEEIQHEQREIFALESLIEEHRDMLNSLDARLETEKKSAVEHDINNLDSRMDTFSMEPDEAQLQIAEKRQILEELDVQLRGLSEAQSQETENNFARMKKKYEAIVKRTELVKNENSEEDHRMHHIMSTAVATLQQLLNDHERCETLNLDIDITRGVNTSLIDGIAQIDERSDTPKSQIIFSAIALRIIRDAGGEIPINELKEKISQAACDQGWKAADGISAVYMLVANRLIVIDRSDKISPVRTNLWNA